MFIPIIIFLQKHLTQSIQFDYIDYCTSDSYYFCKVLLNDFQFGKKKSLTCILNTKELTNLPIFLLFFLYLGTSHNVHCKGFPTHSSINLDPQTLSQLFILITFYHVFVHACLQYLNISIQPNLILFYVNSNINV